MLADPPPLTSALRQIVTNKQMVDRKHMRRAEIRQWTCLIQNGLEICLWVTLVYMGHPWPRWATMGHFGHSSELYMNCIWAIHHRYCRCECCATWWDVEHNGGRPNWIWVKGSSAESFPADWEFTSIASSSCAMLHNTHSFKIWYCCQWLAVSDTNQSDIGKDSAKDFGKVKGNISVSSQQAICSMEVCFLILRFKGLQDVSGGVRIDLDFWDLRS